MTCHMKVSIWGTCSGPEEIKNANCTFGSLTVFEGVLGLVIILCKNQPKFVKTKS